MIKKGIIHIHSNYSTDAKYSVEEWLEILKDYDFILFTEHAEFFDDKKYNEFVERCKNTKLLCIPGLEIEDENGIDILAIGVDELVNDLKYDKIIDNIHKQGGLAVLAHYHPYGYHIPKDYKKINRFDKLDGVEIWNTRHWNIIFKKIVPVDSIRKLKRSGKLAFGSNDEHGNIKFKKMVLNVDVDKLDKNNLMDSLRKGKFCTTYGKFKIKSDGNIYHKNKLIKIRRSILFYFNIFCCYILDLIEEKGGRFIRRFFGNKILKDIRKIYEVKIINKKG